MLVYVDTQPRVDVMLPTFLQEPELVYLVGTAHVSQQSAEDVARVIEAVRPQNVVVELCSSRTAVMYGNENGDENGAAASTAPEPPQSVASAADMRQATSAADSSAAPVNSTRLQRRGSNPLSLRQVGRHGAILRVVYLCQ